MRDISRYDWGNLSSFANVHSGYKKFWTDHHWQVELCIILYWPLNADSHVQPTIPSITFTSSSFFFSRTSLLFKVSQSFLVHSFRKLKSGSFTLKQNPRLVNVLSDNRMWMWPLIYVYLPWFPSRYVGNAKRRGFMSKLKSRVWVLYFQD